MFDDDYEDYEHCSDKNDDGHFCINIFCDVADDEFWELIKFTTKLFTSKIIITHMGKLS